MTGLKRNKRIKSRQKGGMYTFNPAPVKTLFPESSSILGNVDNNGNVNYIQNRTEFSDNSAFVKDIGCPGTNCNATAAASVYSNKPYVPKQLGGSGYRSTTPISPLTSPYAGPGLTESYPSSVPVPRPEGIPRVFPMPVGGSKKYKKSRSNKRSSRSRRSNRINRSNRSKKTKKTKKTKKNRTNRSRKNNRNRSMYGGENDRQPYSNEPISFGMSLGGDLNADNSALASPPPYKPYNDCPIRSRTY
jgi:hypothetical protein